MLAFRDRNKLARLAWKAPGEPVTPSAGALGTRHSSRPLMSEGHEELITSGPSRLASVKQCLEFESESVASH